MNEAPPKKYPLSEMRKLAERRELAAQRREEEWEDLGKLNPRGFRGRAIKVFFGKGDLDPTIDEALPQSIMLFIQTEDDFNYDLLKSVDSKYHFQIARLIIFKGYDGACSVIDHIEKFKNISLEAVGRVLLEKGFFFLILKYENLFSEYPDLISQAKSREIYF